MAAPTLDTAKPVFGANPVDAAMTQLRDNIIHLMTMIMAARFSFPGWAFTPSGADLDEPDYIEGVKNGGSGIKCRFTFTYTAGKVITVLYQYDKGLGAGLETFVDGTVTETYNGSDQWTGNTSA